MYDRRFPIQGTSVPPMLGRDVIMRRLQRALTKPAPDHLQVVGPRFAGKTVILHELARRLRESGGPYTAVFVWDLGHQTPSTDEMFMRRLAHQLSSTLDENPNYAAYAAHLRRPDDSVYGCIGEVLDALKDDGGKVLAIMDGFDKPLSNGQLTRNLWDQLRELALKPSLRLVTASRRTLHDLIRDPEHQTSDFWGIFDPTPVRVGCFDENDMNIILSQLPDFRLTAGAKTELLNATNCFPITTLEVLNTLCGQDRKGEVDHDILKNVCSVALSSMRDKIASLWEDCPPTCQELFYHVFETGSVARAGISGNDADMLAERGFVHQSGNKLERPNRLLAQYLKERPNEASALARLFGNLSSYQQNFKSVLELRIAQLDGMDATLKRYLQRGAEDLPDHPEIFLTNVRGIVNQALDLIWKAELGKKAIPSEWMAIWKYNSEPRVEEWQTTFPQGANSIRLLRLMTGTEKSKPCAKYVTKRTAVLLDAAHQFGNFGQHSEGAPIDPGTAYAALNICVELAAVLTQEVPAGP